MYQLVSWPFSQQFIGHPECFFYFSSKIGFDDSLSQAVFVPESVLDALPTKAVQDICSGFLGLYDEVPEDTCGRGLLFGLSYDEDQEEAVAFLPCAA